MVNSNEKIVVLGADHNGVALKAEVKKLLAGQGYTCVDIGPFTDEQKVDYVDYAKTLGQIMQNGEARWGVLVCGTGVGMDIVANRFSNVRASLAHSVDVAHKTREHNDANVLCLGSWVNSTEDNLEIVRAWFGGAFGEGRHVKRVEKTKDHDKSKIVFTNGVFDILHKGHIDLLKWAKSLGGKLVVGINSDRATRELKGPERPIHNENDRKAILESLGMVDEVVIFDDTKTEGIIAQVQPDILVKGAEWTADEVRKRDNIPDNIEVKVFQLSLNPDFCMEKYSTTSVVEKLKGDKHDHA
ncbi:MAG: hypothetical protein A2751_03075 [Candidatus Doudnabacteria bacterium RIFCSPHIGHO2_01_FULL_46_14]|uniref:Cytidyltransferase-like domain-containing protein n=1 Tax=Candidatus Doudnabacteria bacterium RIFCSPHIGHO2_01_FULL_46_14 TaxID=1817824 RepID=A0A1F5NKB2_9BACT|nr:MAG: hypothetical protein A2751_03075 [Candidatus Doudnabacteria bacterium RIFCSPHIGHO2_01_FULL_46_14]